MRRLVGGLLMLAGVSATAAVSASPKPLCTAATRACLEKTVQAYYAGLRRADGSKVPFAQTVRATEQDRVAVSTREEFLAEFKASGAIEALRNIRMFTDEKKGNVIVFLLLDVRSIDGAPPFTVRRAHRFGVKKGLITEVEIINLEKGSAAVLWPD